MVLRFIRKEKPILSYKFLLFDLDHTLLDFDLAEDVALRLLLEEAGVADVEAYRDYYVPMNKALWQDLTLGKISKADLIATRFAKLFCPFWSGGGWSLLCPTLPRISESAGSGFFWGQGAFDRADSA